ncbi:Pre-mRNA splicing factor PRP21 like protein-domain-containing protein [Lipomyces tetrasporus]|uniref:Pre-mRNA splicing factor PRP21 like protein-domain-containing protein n=1 Tax=Lipomyces tetrasporus TaxID=54092 RepID=A0AAD7QTT3_9ASCO|nr:Pre-mRNA splicing factor PRP21 like protein-domain-containing protein [Lipomyces tetrasporus]KAJ8101204.1 Pre-mRNA splicing factor PRP21 like protein-domain-containing protein [Lipomyces tetrasporus]
MAESNIQRNGTTPQLSHAQISAPVGIIIPPPDIREIIEKTAGYVYRNGAAFETRIRDSEKNNTRFSFLNPADPYYPFYEWRLDERRENRAGYGIAQVDAKEPELQKVEKPKGPVQLPAFEFAASIPPISAQDLDILRLTALFTAKNGKSFSNMLSQREERNYQFDFLRPNHSFYQYFTKLVEQYRKVLNPPRYLSDRWKENLKNKFHVIEKAQQRADWQKHQEAETQKAAEEAEAERIAYAQIDWHDFVVVETIEFTSADDGVELPPPMSLSELEHASLEQKQMMSLFNDASRIESETAPLVEEEMLEIPAPRAAVSPSPALEESEEEQRIRERQEGLRRQRQAEAAALNPGLQSIRVLPQGSTRRSTQKASKIIMQECPLCHQQIPSSEFQEHMRIEQLHPRWKEEKAKIDARNAISNLAFSDVTSNIKRLASARSDLFDSDGTALTPEEAQRRKRQQQ